MTLRWTFDEIEPLQEEEAIERHNEAIEREQYLACEWRSARNADIEVWAYAPDHITVYVNGNPSVYAYDEIRPLTVREKALPFCKNIVAVLGPVGLTAERKEAIERKVGIR